MIEKSTTSADKIRARTAFQRVMRLAERLKDEIDILDKSSYLNGNQFRPWSGKPERAEFEPMAVPFT